MWRRLIGIVAVLVALTGITDFALSSVASHSVVVLAASQPDGNGVGNPPPLP